MSSKNSILVIIPAYNEAGKIGKVVNKIKDTKLKCKILVIDDLIANPTYAV